MTKNILKYDVVHHMKSMMQAGEKITLPLVVSTDTYGAPNPLPDDPHRSAGFSCPKNLWKIIKLSPIPEEGVYP